MDILTFIEQLLSIVPELKLVYEEHLADNDTLLPHVFMGDVTRFVMTASRNTPGCAALRRLLMHVENGLSAGDDEVRELILASFVENLIGEHDALHILRPLMGSHLGKKVEALCGD